MKLKIENKTTKSLLVPEGLYAAVVKTVMVNTKEGTQEPVSVVVGFEVLGHKDPVTRSYPPRLGGRSPLLSDSLNILRRGLTLDEKNEGIDPELLVGHSCRVMIKHQQDGGTHKAAVKAVLAAEAPVVPTP